MHGPRKIHKVAFSNKMRLGLRLWRRFGYCGAVLVSLDKEGLYFTCIDVHMLYPIEVAATAAPKKTEKENEKERLSLTNPCQFGGQFPAKAPLPFLFCTRLNGSLEQVIKPRKGKSQYWYGANNSEWRVCASLHIYFSGSKSPHKLLPH